MHKDLTQRGTFLKKGNFKEATEIEDQIKKEIIDKEEELKRPVHAFVIFES